MPLSAAEKQKRYREKLKNNREKYEEAKMKQRARYHKNKKLVKDLTPKERYNANVIWRLRKRQTKARKLAIESVLQHTPPDSPRSDSRLGYFEEFHGTPPPTPPRATSPPDTPPRARDAPTQDRDTSQHAKDPPLRSKILAPWSRPPTPTLTATDQTTRLRHPRSRDPPPQPAKSRYQTRQPKDLPPRATDTLPRVPATTSRTLPTPARATATLARVPATPPRAPATPPRAPATPPRATDTPLHSSLKKAGRKKVKVSRSRVYRENTKLKQDNEKLRRKYERFKKRCQRQIDDETNETEKTEDLRYKVLSGAIKKTFKKMKSRKEREVIKKIFSTVEVKDSRMKKKILMDTLGVDKVTKSIDCTDKNTVLKKKLKEFYLRDDISRATAGKKETLTKSGVKKQKRFMLDTMKNLFKTFVKENPDIRCSYFYFTRNKPFYVRSASIDARDMCLCKTHTNFAYKAKALKRKNVISTDDLNILIASTVCNVNSKDCMYGKCNQCASKTNSYFMENVKGTITWTEWVRKEEKYEKDGKKMKAIKNLKEDRSEETLIFLQIFESDLEAFKKHVFNIKSQFQNFRRCLENIRPSECVIVADFSENYSCKYSQEVQSHHFGGSRKQVSLHTVVVYTFDGASSRGYKVNSFCSISASNNHQPAAIWSHLDPILRYIRSDFKEVNTVHFYSDGPSTQYRQKQNFFLMCTKFFDYGFNNMTWSFFEAGHGKGPADGIGGFLKRTADTMVANGEDIADVQQFLEKMNSVSKIKLYLIAEKDIQDQHKALPNNIPRLVGTLKVHQVFSNTYGELKFRDLSCFCEPGNLGVRGFCMCLDPKTYSVGFYCNADEIFDSISDLTNYDTPLKDLTPEDIDLILTNSNLEITNVNLSTTNQNSENTSEDDEPLSNLKISKQLQDLTNRHQRIYEDIYGGSSSEEELACVSHDQSSKIGCGDFLLVKLHVDSSKKKTYTYACKALTDVENDGEVKVMFLRVMDENGKRFRVDEKDISYVDYEDIIQKLPVPEIMKKGYRSYYYFKKSVDVFEKK